jgi:catechol 2,3-dioxygenase-like lactoylglutathione lyase family enzyme
VQLHWSHAVLYVRDLQPMVDFYREILGFRVSDRGPLLGDKGGPEIVFMSQVPEDHHQIAFLPTRQGEERSNSVDHFAFRVTELGDVREMIARLRQDGRAEEINTVTHGNAWSVYFRDPEGNGIEIFCDTPWHVAQPVLERWDETATDEELHATTLATFEDRESFGPMAEYVRERKQEFADG